MEEIVHGSGVILIRKDGAVLVQHRDNNPKIHDSDLWCYPGGKVEKEESFEEAARRELQEETGYHARELLLFLEEEDISRHTGKPHVRHLYWTWYDDKQKIICGEGQEMRWMKSEEFTERKFIPKHDERYRLALKLAGF